jgi:hypothetical protein
LQLPEEPDAPENNGRFARLNCVKELRQSETKDEPELDLPSAFSIRRTGADNRTENRNSDPTFQPAPPSRRNLL